jgi:hypothetical protein
VGPVVLFLLEVALEPYVPLTPATFAYRTSADEVLTVELLAVQIEGAPAAVRMGSDRRRRVESFDAEEGLLVHRVGLGRYGGELVYERPLPILPARLTTGEIHSSQRRFARMRGGSKEDVGAHYVEAELLGVEDLSISGEVFPDCLRIRRHETRMDFSGGQAVYDATEWYAKGVGMVKAQGQRLEKDEHGEILSREVFDFWIVSSGEP